MSDGIYCLEVEPDKCCHPNSLIILFPISFLPSDFSKFIFCVVYFIRSSKVYYSFSICWFIFFLKRILPASILVHSEEWPI